MTPTQIQDIQQALEGLSQVVSVPVADESRAEKFVFPFQDRNGDAFTFYAYLVATTGRVNLTDAGAVLRTLRKSGMDVHFDVLQQVMGTFGLSVLDDGSVLECTDRPISQRVIALFQGLVTADGILRTWTLPKETR